METKSNRWLGLLLGGIITILVVTALDLKDNPILKSPIKIQPKIETTKQGDTIYVYEIQQR